MEHLQQDLGLEQLQQDLELEQLQQDLGLEHLQQDLGLEHLQQDSDLNLDFALYLRLLQQDLAPVLVQVGGDLEHI